MSVEFGQLFPGEVFEFKANSEERKYTAFKLNDESLVLLAIWAILPWNDATFSEVKKLGVMEPKYSL